MLQKYLIPLVILLKLVCGSSIIVSIDTDPDPNLHIVASDFEKQFYNDYKNYITTGDDSELMKLKVILEDEQNGLILDDIPKTIHPHLCLKCRALTNTIIQLKKQDKKDVEFLVTHAKSFCKNFTGTNEKVCDGIVNLSAPVIDFILSNSTSVDSNKVCSIHFQYEGCGTDFEYPEFKIDFKESQPVPRFEFVQPASKISSDPIILAHITDVHYDPYYSPGGNAKCAEGICCRSNQGPPSSPENAAGKWGDYRSCDSPWEAIVDIVHHLKSQYPKIDYVYFTGDIVDHFGWETTKEGNLQSIRKFFKLLKDEFQGIPVFPVLGNHEAHPSNAYSPMGLRAPSDITIQWLYDFAAEQWSDWLPANTLETIKSEGHYTVLISPGFRIIALNSNTCYGSNIWLFHNSTLFTDQLQWLHDTLYAASLDKELVHIIGHVPSNDPLCFAGWTKVYRQIIEKFGHIISGQFNGHSHEDEINVYYAKDDTSKVVSVAWNGGSGTPFSMFNPNYRVYQLDAETHQVLNFDTWIYNLTEANLHPNENPRWFKEYTFKEAYGLTDLSIESMDGLVQKLARDKNLLKQYWMYKIKQADPYLKEGCDDKCLLKHLCDIVRIQYGDMTKCDELSRIFWGD